MLNKNIKNLNKMLVKNNDNMFGGSTKRPPPPTPPPSLSTLSTPSRTEQQKTQLTSPEFSPTPTSPPSSSSGSLISPSSPPLPPLTTTKKLFPAALQCSTVGVSILSSKSMSVSSLTSQSSALLPTTTPTTEVRTTAAAAATIFSGKTKLLQRHRHRQIQQQQQQYHHHHHHHHHTPQLRFRLLPGLKATSFFTILTLVCLETVLLSTVSNCAKTFYMHWNTSNSIFRIDNTDHIIDVNKGNLAFEFDQVHIICPVYEPGTFENETEKYIIYNVSKVEYETCRITNADPRVIAICDKPQKLMFFTITFRPFTPQPGGLEFLPGNDYYFISTSSKDDLYRRIGGRCSTNNMKVVFKVCCAPEDKNNRTNNNIGGGNGSGGGIGNGGGNSGIGSGSSGSSNSNTAIQQQHNNNINVNGGGGGGGIGGGGGGGGGGSGGQLPSPKLPGMGGGLMINGNSGTSINTNIDQFNRIPMQQPNNIGGIGSSGGMGMNGNGGVSGQHQTGIRINNVPSSQQHPSQKNDDYDKHPNEVVKNEELTYNSASSLYKMTRRRAAATTLTLRRTIRYSKTTYKSIYQKFKSLLQLLLFTSNHRNRINTINTFINFISNCNPIIITTTVLVTLTNLFQYKLSSWSLRRWISSSKTAAAAAATTSSLSSLATRTSCELRPLPKLSTPQPPLPPSPPPPPLSPVDCIKTTVEPLSKTLNIASSTR